MAPLSARLASRRRKSSRSRSSRNSVRRSIPRTITWCSTPRASRRGPLGMNGRYLNSTYNATSPKLIMQRSISRMKKTHEDRLPQYRPLLPKMTARKKGFSPVEAGSRANETQLTPNRRRSPMPIIRPNAIRIKRFRDLKADLRTRRDRLLVGIDIAKAQHVAQGRLAHTQVLDGKVDIPNTRAGFARFWGHLEGRRRETGVSEVVCAVEPTGTYHDAL